MLTRSSPELKELLDEFAAEASNGCYVRLIQGIHTRTHTRTRTSTVQQRLYASAVLSLVNPLPCDCPILHCPKLNQTRNSKRRMKPSSYRLLAQHVRKT